MRNLRDYGMGDSTPYVDGAPTVVNAEGPACPNCGCDHTYLIQVKIKGHPIIKEGIGTYAGCACCPYATPMIMMGRASL